MTILITLIILFLGDLKSADPSRHAIWGVDIDRLYDEIVGSNPT